MEEKAYRYTKEAGDIIRVDLGQGMEFYFHNDAQALAIYQGLTPNQKNDERCFADGYCVKVFDRLYPDAEYRLRVNKDLKIPKNAREIPKEEIFAEMKKDYDKLGPAAILNEIIMLGMMQVISEGCHCHAYGTSDKDQEALKARFYDKSPAEEDREL